MEKKNYISSSHNVVLDEDYGKWLSSLKSRYQYAQVRAAVKVNGERLLWNWQLGRDLVMRKAEERWGAGIVEQLSLDLQATFPGEKGFGASNLWYMKKWYQFYTKDGLSTITDEKEKLEQAVQETHDIILHQAGGELVDTESEGIPFPKIFALVPWRHHVEIITKCKDVDEAMFYIRMTIEENWSRATLMNCINANLYSKQGKAVTNFNTVLPIPQAELAQEITKENYDFGFLTLPKKYDEEQLENALCEQMTRFLLELGKGFAFMGRQKELVVAGRSRRIDLLFYHIHLRCYVVVELKAVPFQPEFAGKLNFYVNSVNHLMKTPDENPTIGLLICSDMNTTEVQWSFENLSTPIGVATYNNVQIEEIKKQLPTIEELQARIKLLEKELKR